jgi:hypothetical protein
MKVATMSKSELRLTFNKAKTPPLWELDPYSDDLQKHLFAICYPELNECYWLDRDGYPPADLAIRRYATGVFIRGKLGKDFNDEVFCPTRYPRGTAPSAKAAGKIWKLFYQMAAVLYADGHCEDHPLRQMRLLICSGSGLLLPWCLPKAPQGNPWLIITAENADIRGRKDAEGNRVFVNPFGYAPTSRNWLQPILDRKPFGVEGLPRTDEGEMLLAILKARSEFIKTWHPASKRKGGKGYKLRDVPSARKPLTAEAKISDP